MNLNNFNIIRMLFIILEFKLNQFVIEDIYLKFLKITLYMYISFINLLVVYPLRIRNFYPISVSGI